MQIINYICFILKNGPHLRYLIQESTSWNWSGNLDHTVRCICLRIFINNKSIIIFLPQLEPCFLTQMVSYSAENDYNFRECLCSKKSDKICPAFYCSNCTEKIKTDNHFLQVTAEAVAEDFSCSDRCFFVLVKSKTHTDNLCFVWQYDVCLAIVFLLPYRGFFNTCKPNNLSHWNTKYWKSQNLYSFCICDYSNCVRKNKKYLK